MNVYFDNKNSNALIFEEGTKKYHVAVPPSKNSIDILDFNGINKFQFMKTETYYLYNVDAFVIITSSIDRKVYRKGELICQTILNY